MAGIKSNSCDRKEENYLMNGQQVQLIRRSTPRVLAMRASALFALAYAFAVRANAAAAGTLPWERPMTAIATSLTGPVAYAIGLIGIAIAGGAMLWGGELTEFGRRACMIGLVVSVLVFAAPMLSSAFGVTAAVI
jgi:type IV secretory pathway VirB2 component (pilin)